MIQAERILIVRTSALGDVVRGASALASLRRAYPRARIDWLVTGAFAGAIEQHPALSNVVVFPRKELGAWLRSGDWGLVQEWVEGALRKPGYDLVIDLQGLLRSGLLTLATGAARRVGFADAREMGWIGYTDRARVEGGRGAAHVDRNFALLRAVGVEPVVDQRIYPDEKDRGVMKGRYVLLSPTTKGFGRAWPMERYAELARHLLAERKRLGVDAVVVVGLENERELCRTLLTVEGVVDRVGGTSVSGLMGLVEGAGLVVCNDSAVMHMAVAFGRPLVALFGPTDVGHAGPYGRAQDVISHKGAHEQVRHRDVARASEFMRRISVDEVIAACESRLGR